MKCLNALLMTSLVLGACEKSDNVTQLREQAVAIGKTYTPRAEELDKRRQEIFQRGKNVPGNLPDVPEVVRLIGEAGDKITEMKGITSAIDKQAEDAAKNKKVDELQKLIDESQEKLEADETIANEDLTRVEGWLWQYEQGHATPAAAPKEPVPTPNETGEPPPAAAGSGAGSAAAPKAEEKAAKGAAKTDDKTEKAAQKAAAEKADKKAAPADKADKKAAPADKAEKKTPAAPKAGSGAGSAAK